MKRLLLIALATFLGCGAQAQGTFIFSNLVPTAGVNQPVFDWDMSQVAGSHMVAAIFLQGVQLGNPAPFRTGSGAGYWDPGPDNLRVVRGKFAGEVIDGFTVQVWDISRGRTLPASRDAAGITGQSASFRITLGGPKADPLLPLDLPGVMVNFNAFQVMIPEPSVMALGALGAIMLVAARGRRLGRTTDWNRETNP